MSRSITIRGRLVLGATGAGAFALAAALVASSPSYAAPPSGTSTNPATGSSSVTATLPTTTSGSGTVTTSTSRPTGGSGWSDTPTTPISTSSTCPTTTYTGSTPRDTQSSVAPGQQLQAWDFESGTTEGWTATGASAAVTDAAASSGTHSLAVTGLGAGSDVTATVSSTLAIDWYLVTAKVRLAPGQSPQWLRLRADAGYDNQSVPGYVRATGDGWAEVTAWYHPLTSLNTVPPCYPRTMAAPTPLHLSLVAVDCAGNASAGTNLYLDDVRVVRRSADQTGTPTAGSTAPSGCSSSTPPVTCGVSAKVVSQWSGGFQASITVTNLTDRTLSGWKLGWTFLNGEKVTTAWGTSTWSQSGATVTATGADWATLRPGGTATVGFLGSAPGLAAGPQGITLNGNSCTLGG